MEHLSKLKDSLESELEEHESMVSELTEQVGFLCITFSFENNIRYRAGS